MIHPGIPMTFVWIALGLFFGLLVWSLVREQSKAKQPARKPLLLRNLPLLGAIIKRIDHRRELLLSLKLISVALFLLIIAAGLWGTPLGARNMATTVTWTLWWSLVILTIPLVGTAWCAVCPWDTLAGWLVRFRLWGNKTDTGSLNLTPPRWLRTVWPAAILFIALSWLELGTELITSPLATALLALGMLLLALLFLALFERKTFCRYVCPVGRTIGCYSQLAAIELRPIQQATCSQCETLDCYHGNAQAEPCPTQLTMGRFAQNTYCLSCGACSVGCPKQNVSWHLRPLAKEAAISARPHGDEAWFMLILLSLTSFHGITMITQWDTGLKQIAQLFNTAPDSLWVFSIAMLLGILPPLILYSGTIKVTAIVTKQTTSFRQLFNGLAFSLLPIAFTYHLAHNLGHLIQESINFLPVLADPFGSTALEPENVWNLMDHSISLQTGLIVAGIQTALLVIGLALGLHILRSRFASMDMEQLVSRVPMKLLLTVYSGFNLWLLTQPMTMRM